MAEPRRMKLVGHGVLHLELEIDQENSQHEVWGRDPGVPRPVTAKFKLSLHFDREDVGAPREFHTQGVLVPQVRDGYVVAFNTRAPDGDLGRCAWEYDAAKLIDVANKYLHLTTDRRDRLYVVTATAEWYTETEFDYQARLTAGVLGMGARVGPATNVDDWLKSRARKSVAETWDVAAYWDKEQAEDHAKRAQECPWHNGVMPYDPSLQHHHRNVRYAVKEVMVCRHVDEYLENT